MKGDTGVWPVNFQMAVTDKLNRCQPHRCSQTKRMIEFLRQRYCASQKVLLDCDDSIAEGLDRVCPYSNCIKNILIKD